MVFCVGGTAVVGRVVCACVAVSVGTAEACVWVSFGSVRFSAVEGEVGEEVGVLKAVCCVQLVSVCSVLSSVLRTTAVLSVALLVSEA